MITKEDFNRLIDDKTYEAPSIRVNKYLSDAGYCSRREADRLLEKGEVFIDGKVAVLGQKVENGQVVTACGQEVIREDEFILLALNKPVGIECTADSDNPDNIVDYVGFSKRVYPIGRLDKNSRGLILLTNNGAIVNRIMRSANMHEKEYVVKVNKDITEEFLSRMRSGVDILETTTRECRVQRIDKRTFEIVLTQGLNRQIRRMCEALGYEVTDLRRVRVLNILLGDLKEGSYRRVSEKEISELAALIK